MKRKLAITLLGLLLTATFAVADEPNATDQKWLKAVGEMVAKGEKKISTPKEDRANLLKEWGEKKGYAIKVTKTETGYSIEVTPSDKAKSVAQK